MYEIDFIEPNVLYLVSGTSASIVYSGVTYNAGDNFRGVYGETGFTSTNSPSIFEVLELKAGGIEFATNALDQPVYSDVTMLNGMAVEYNLNSEEEIVNDVTKIQGFSIEFLYFSPYVFQITKTKTKI